MKSENFIKSLGYALKGLRETALRERNFRYQIIIGFLTIIFCLIFRVETQLFLLACFAICLVLAMELTNTAIEAVVDLVAGDEIKPLAKIAKDAAAAAVLIASLFSIIVGFAIIFNVIERYVT